LNNFVLVKVACVASCSPRNTSSHTPMSSISFPHSGDADLVPSSSLRDSMQAQFYTPPGFDVSGSFQMNPLSAHPPRTPRPSTTQSHFGNTTASVYDEKSEATEKGVAGDAADEDEEVDEESERVAEAEKKSQ